MTGRPDFALMFLAECFRDDFRYLAAVVYDRAIRHNREGWTTWLALMLDAEAAS